MSLPKTHLNNIIYGSVNVPKEKRTINSKNKSYLKKSKKIFEENHIQHQFNTEYITDNEAIISKVVEKRPSKKLFQKIKERTKLKLNHNSIDRTGDEYLSKFNDLTLDTFKNNMNSLDVYSLPASLSSGHPTLKIIRDRYLSKSKPNKRKDKYKLGLVVEGGGMRGSVTGAMIMELHALGLKNVFDAVYGSSAGAMNATYFLTEQEKGLDIYFEDIANKRFIDFRRMLGPDPVINLEYLIHWVIGQVKPLDYKKLLNSEIPLKIIASCLHSLKPVILSDFKTAEDLIMAMKASCTVPEMAGSPREISGYKLVDAAVFEPIPYRSAIQDGCTHVLALCSRPRQRGARGRAMKALKQILVKAIKNFILNPPYMKKAWKAEIEAVVKDGGLNQDDLMVLTFMQGLKGFEPVPVGGHVFPIYPSTKFTISPTCLDVTLLKKGAEDGKKAVREFYYMCMNHMNSNMDNINTA